MNKPIPENLIQRPDGSYVDLKTLPPRKQLAHDMVCRLFPKAIELRDDLTVLKRTTLSEMEAYRSIMHEEFETDVTGKGGGFSVKTVCGTKKIELSFAKHVSFGEELEAAKALLDEFLEDILGDLAESTGDETDGQSSAEIIRDIVQAAFKVNSKGRLSTEGILGLSKHNWRHPKFLRALDAIDQAINRDSETTYTRYYLINPETKVETLVALDMAKV